MCGIAGIVGLAPDAAPVVADELRAMAAELVHRGPDDEGYHLDARGRCGLAFRRLSIIDLKTGQQPISNDDGSVQVVFNGEIYNFRELRRELSTR
ncbi:MAG: asparagine synthetase B, partial [Planctomycetes bacterium]|nr:asparagine synthetase B [Planctomycetota bacterium]